MSEKQAPWDRWSAQTREAVIWTLEHELRAIEAKAALATWARFPTLRAQVEDTMRALRELRALIGSCEVEVEAVGMGEEAAP